MGKIADKNIYIIITLFLASHLLIYNKIGVVSILESQKYIRQAELLLSGQFPSAPKYFYYLPIILLIALIKKISLSYLYVVIIQSLFSLIATIAFYRGTKIIFDSPTALFSSILLCLFFPFYIWNFHLYSDSIFISLSLFLYYAICKFEYQTLKGVLGIFLVLVALILSRPFGVLFVPPLFLYFFLTKYRNKKVKLFTFSLSLIFLFLMALIIDDIFHGGEDMSAMKPFIEEHIICLLPTNPKGSKLDLKYYDNGLKDIMYYVTHNPLHFSKLMLQRLYSFFKLTRPWFGRGHNLYLTFFTIPVYIFFLVGLFPFLKLKSKAGVYFLALIILYSFAVTFQCDDWHGRFTMPIIPPILAISIFGLLNLLKKTLLASKINYLNRASGNRGNF